MRLWFLVPSLLGGCTEPSTVQGVEALHVDCEDGEATVTVEVCDGADNDCDGLVDDDPADGTTYYRDLDGDGYGDEWRPVRACEQPRGATANFDDCDDNDREVHPGGTDDCVLGVDRDCDGVVAGTEDADEDGVMACKDCDDSDPLRAPGQVERCDEIDRDCDGDPEAGAVDASTWYRDDDDDTYGDRDSATRTECDAPKGFVADDRDCDDTDAGIHPAAFETCDDLDRDCDGDPVLGALDAAPFYFDNDDDGYGDPGLPSLACVLPPYHASNPDDCDDSEPKVHPGAEELCDDIDQDCDGDPVEGADGLSTFYADLDQDGLGGWWSVVGCEAPSGFVAVDGDCDDTDSTVQESRTWYADADGDGFGDPAVEAVQCDAPANHVADSGDCDDEDEEVHPDADELCADAVDNDCDGETSEDDAADATLWHADVDGDGFGSPHAAFERAACEAPPGFVGTATDCRDGDDQSFVGGTEVCDGFDNDCNGTADDLAVDFSRWYQDADGDGYGNSAVSVLACEAPSDHLDDDSDCDDDPVVGIQASPGGVEVCGDDIDNDCNGTIDDVDADGDGATACGGVDCDDLDDDAHPGAVEPVSPNGIDEDCDGDPDDGLLVGGVEYGDDVTWDTDRELSGLHHVLDGATLTVSAGVTLTFVPGARLLVDGEIQLAGTEDDPVTFAAAIPGDPNGPSVVVSGTGDASNLDDSEFLGVDLWVRGAASAQIATCLFDDATLQIEDRDDPFLVLQCVFENGYASMRDAVVARNADVTVQESAFSLVYRGLRCEGDSDCSSVDSTFTDTFRALALRSDTASNFASVTGTTIAGTDDDAIAADGVALTVTDTNLSDVAGNAIDVVGDDALTVTDVVIADVQGSGIFAESAPTSLSGVTATDVGGDGARLGPGSTVDGFELEGAGGYGIVSQGALTVLATTVSGADLAGIRADGDLTLTGTEAEPIEISDGDGNGVEVRGGTGSLEEVWTHDLLGNGVYAEDGSVDVSGCTVSAVANGIFGNRASVTATDCVITGTTGAGITTAYGDIEVTDSVIGGDDTSEAIAGSGVQATIGNVVATDTDVIGARGQGFYAHYGDLTVIGTESDPSVVRDVVGIGLYAYAGALTAQDVSVENPQSYGLYAYAGELFATDVEVVDGWSIGLFANASDATIEGVSVENGRNIGLYFVDGTATVTDVAITDGSSHGISAARATLTVDGATITRPLGIGIHGSDTNLDLKDVTITSPEAQGVFQNAGQSAVLDNVIVTDSNSIGIDLRPDDVNTSSLTLTDITITGSDSWQFHMNRSAVPISISRCLVANGLTHAMYVYSLQPSTLSACNIQSNGGIAVHGNPRAAGNSLSVLGNNLTGNASYANYFVELADGNYVAGNLGTAANTVDTTSVSTNNNVLDGNTSQNYGCDRIINPKSTAVAGTGPT